MLKVLLILAAAFILFELVEHVVIPLVWLISKKNRMSPTGESGMIGQVAEVKQWDGKRGKVFVHGELWKAESDDSFEPGEEAVIYMVKRLVLILKRKDG